MGEKKYAIAGFYGYGHYRYVDYYSRGTPHYYFDSDIYFPDLKFSTQVEPISKGITITANNTSKPRKIGVPLYLVEEDGIWREYFTGTVIKFYNFSGQGGIIKELVFGNIHGGADFSYSEPKVFADAISKYTEEQIKEMAGQFLQLCNDAVVWSRNYDAVPEKHRQMELKREQDNKLASEKLEHGVGQYSDVSPTRSVPLPVSAQKENDGCLTAIFMVLALVLSIWWVF